MTAKSVATKDEVIAVVSTTGPGGASGSWTAGPIVPTSYAQLTVDSNAVIYQANCIFTFTFSNGTTTTEPVTLTAGSTHLQGSSSNVLRDGDFIKSTNGNLLKVVSSRRLRSE
jgi:hypothetical protein